LKTLKYIRILQISGYDNFQILVDYKYLCKEFFMTNPLTMR
jgi:hypothetical protein